jgi:hypothetical protein
MRQLKKLNNIFIKLFSNNYSKEDNMKKLLLALSVSILSLNSFAIELKLPSDNSDKTIKISKAVYEEGETRLYDKDNNLRLSYTFSGATYTHGYKFSYYNKYGLLINSTIRSDENKDLLQLMINTTRSTTPCGLEFIIDGSSIGVNKDLVIKSISSNCDVFAQANLEDNQA